MPMLNWFFRTNGLGSRLVFRTSCSRILDVLDLELVFLDIGRIVASAKRQYKHSLQPLPGQERYCWILTFQILRCAS